MARHRHENQLKDLLGAIGTARIDFWECPTEGHNRVTWTGSEPRCDTCGMTRTMERAAIQRWTETTEWGIGSTITGPVTVLRICHADTETAARNEAKEKAAELDRKDPQSGWIPVCRASGPWLPAPKGTP